MRTPQNKSTTTDTTTYRVTWDDSTVDQNHDVPPDEIAVRSWGDLEAGIANVARSHMDEWQREKPTDVALVRQADGTILGYVSAGFAIVAHFTVVKVV